MRAIVTGGAGFIGSNVADALLARGDEVHVLDDLSKGKRENVPAGAELHVTDIRSPDDVFDAVRPDGSYPLKKLPTRCEPAGVIIVEGAYSSSSAVECHGQNWVLTSMRSASVAGC